MSCIFYTEENRFWCITKILSKILQDIILRPKINNEIVNNELFYKRVSGKSQMLIFN
jgi:hypothetical protein